MSIELVAKAKKTRLGGDSTTKLLLIVLADYANDDRQAWPSVATLAAEVEVGDRTIQRSLRKLESMGLIGPGDQRLTKGYPKGQKPLVYQVFPERKHHYHTGDTTDTPTGDTHDTGSGDTHDITPATHMTPPRCHPSANTGDTHVTQTVIEPPIEPSRESTRTPKTTTTNTKRRQALAELTPNQSHQTIATQYGLNLTNELAKFQDTCLAKNNIPADPAAAFRVWLRRAPEIGLTNTNPDNNQPALTDRVSDLERRACKLVDTSTPLKHRQPDRSARLEWVPAISRLLERGMDPVAIVNLICSGTQEELADHGITMDELEEIA